MRPPSDPPADLPIDLPADLLPKVFTYVKAYMAHYDGSHDYAHILRVLGLAHTLRAQDPARYDHTTITFAALLHDVGDKKYLLPDQDSATLVRDVLVSLGAPAPLAAKIQTIVSAVSYSAEIKDPARVRDVIARFPELEVVQDADRLDAIGVVGIGRTFTFGGARGARGMDGTLEHFVEKLERLEGMMKTGLGRRMARARTERLVAFRRMWEEEMGEAEGGLEGLEGVRE
jgi:uncharacterized protein